MGEKGLTALKSARRSGRRAAGKMRSASRIAAIVCVAGSLAVLTAGGPAQAYTKSSITIDGRTGLVLQAHNAERHPPACVPQQVDDAVSDLRIPVARQVWLEYPGPDIPPRRDQTAVETVSPPRTAGPGARSGLCDRDQVRQRRRRRAGGKDLRQRTPFRTADDAARPTAWHAPHRVRHGIRPARAGPTDDGGGTWPSWPGP